jgi:hypothetical protein
MVFRLWCGLAQTEAEYRALKPHWMTRTRDSLNDTLWTAMQCNDAGPEVAWEIEGDDGSRLNRQEIADLVRLRRAN